MRAVLLLLCVAAATASSVSTVVRVFQANHPDHNAPGAGLRAPLLLGHHLTDAGLPTATDGLRLFDTWFRDSPLASTTVFVGNDTVAAVVVADTASMVTVHMRFSAVYEPTCTLSIDRADGDAWLYVNGLLAIDGGGIAPPGGWNVGANADAPWDAGETMDVALFAAQRHAGSRVQGNDTALVWSVRTSCLLVNDTAPVTTTSLATKPCPLQCQNGGVCVGTDTPRCACGTGWCGHECERNTCSGNGFWQGQCRCMSAWSGAECAECAGPQMVDMDGARQVMWQGQGCGGGGGGVCSGAPHEHLLAAPQNLVDVTHDTLVDVCAPMADGGYIRHEMSQAFLDMYMRQFFALGVSKGYGDLVDHRPQVDRARGPVMPASVSRYDGLYYDCECRAWPLVEADAVPAAYIKVDGPREALGYSGPAPAPTWWVDVPAVADDGQCVSWQATVERMERQHGAYRAHVARAVARSELDSPASAPSGGLVIFVFASAAVFMVFMVLFVATDGIAVRHKHRVVAGVMTGAQRAGTLVKLVLWNQDVAKG